MSSTTIFLDNLKRYYKVDSIRKLADKMELSRAILLNWSSGRSSPSLNQVDNIAYNINVEASQLLIENNVFSVETPIWRDRLMQTFQYNLSRFRLEKDIHEKIFTNYVDNNYNLSYRSFLRYVNGKNKRINLNAIDNLSKILSIQSYKLLESEKIK